jgi:hypothetical protein
MPAKLRTWLAAAASAGPAQVSLDGQDAAVPVAGPDLLVQGGGAGDAVVPPLVQVRLERVQDAGSADGRDLQLVDAGRVGELQDHVAVQFQAAGDQHVAASRGRTTWKWLRHWPAS